MKTQMFRAWTLGVVVFGLAVGTGCHEEQARAEVPDIDKLVPQLAQIDSTAPASTPLDLAAADLEKTNVSTNVAMPKLVANPTMPENLNVSPALAEVLKLAQAGVSEDVLMAYITNSTTFFNVSSDAIVYLNDLGVPNNVITALIQHDATPEMQARKQAAGAVQPLPPGVALNAPATNVYPPSVSQTTPAPDQTTAPPPPADAQVATVAEPEQPASVSYFYSSLAPYGTWLEVDGYGLCWQPTVVVSNPRWRPYADRGRWLWSDHGWYWYSDYSWGWAPFHYGRWCDYPRLGWIWVPDTHWGPSWVSWRYSSSYCGWAPLPPSCHYRPGFGFTYYGSSVGFGFDFGLSFHHYNYVPFNRFCDRSPGLYVLPGHRARAVHRETTVVNNYVVGNNNRIVNNGVGRDRVAAANRGQVPTATVREVSTRNSTRREQLVSNGSSLAVVRPTLPERPERSHVAVPSRAVNRVRVTDNTPATAASNPDNSRPFTAGAGTPTARQRPVSQTRSPESGVSTPEARTPATAANTGGDSSRSRPVATPRESLRSTVARPNPTFRTYNSPVTPNTDSSAGRVAPQSPATQSSSPQTPRSTVAARTQVSPSTPVVRTPAPTVNRPTTTPNTPGVSRPVTTPSGAPSSASSPTFRSYANPSPSRPNVQAPPSRPTAPSASAPVARPPSFSSPAARPEPSRPAPSYSAPARSSAPTFSAPAARSVSPPASRPSPSFSSPSAPSRSSSSVSPGASGGRGRGGRD